MPKSVQLSPEPAAGFTLTFIGQDKNCLVAAFI
jgi:hypothetical protein